MATKNIVPRADGEGQIGTTTKAWGKVVTDELTLINAANEISTDGTLAGSSDSAIPTEKAAKTYVDASNKFKVGSFTRDLTAASGDVTYTGVGFQPKAIIFFGSALDYYESMGFSDGTNHMSRYHNLDSIYAIFQPDMSYCIHAGSPTVYQDAIVKTLNADGFTLTWTKAGSPTGTFYVEYLAIR